MLSTINSLPAALQLLGVGCDLVEISRFEKLRDDAQFIARVLTQEEASVYASKTNLARKSEWLAGRFCAKEAISKALGVGIGKHFSFLDVSVMNNEWGAPNALIANHRDAHPLAGLSVHLSISHTDKLAQAFVVISRAVATQEEKFESNDKDRGEDLQIGLCKI